MVYQNVRNGSTEYAVDWETIDRLNRSFRLAEATLISSRKVALNESSWYNPFSWSLPTIYNIEVDWHSVRNCASYLSMQDMLALGAIGSNSMAEVGYQMLARIKQTHQLKANFRAYLATANASNQQSIAGAVDSYEGLVEAAKFVRDTSFDIVGVGATILTGGAAATVALGASAALKGGAKYQDTGSVGLATAQFAGYFVFGAFKIRPALGFSKMTSSGEYVLILCRGAFESGTSLAAGDSFSKAAQEGALKIVGDGGAKFMMNTSIAKALIEKMPIPVNVWVQTDKNKFVDEANKIAGKVVEKIGANVTSKVVGPAVIKARSGGNANDGGGAGAWADDVAVVDETLLQLAIVHMQKGVGWGW